MAPQLDLSVKTVVGAGAHAILLEPRAGAIRVKARGVPEFFVPFEVAGELAGALAALARNLERARR